MDVPQVFSFEHYRLDLFCAIWTTISFGYTVVVAVWMIGFGESKLVNWSLIKHLIGSAGISNMTWTLYREGYNLKGAKEVFMGILATVSLLSAVMTYIKHIKGREPKWRDMSRKVVIVTGSNAGIGFETAKSLVDMGAHVIMACRNEILAKEAIESITDDLLKVSSLERRPEGPSIKGKISFMALDLASLDSVRSFVAEFKKQKLPLDVLILNAGVMMGRREVTIDGYETTFQVNHLSHFLLTNELLDLLEKSDDGRIVVVTSALYKKISSFDFDDIQTLKKYGMFKVYAKTKMANMMFGLQLNSRLRAKKSNVMVNMVHPGMVLSNISKNMKWYMRLGDQICRPVFMLLRKQPSHGAFTSVFAATSTDLRDETGAPYSGLFFMNNEPRQINVAARYLEDNEKLWKISEELCNKTKSK